MTDAFDGLSAEARRAAHGWFGDPWHSGVCLNDDDSLREEMRKPFPAGESCLYCGEPFSEEAGDSGQAVPFLSASAPPEIRHVHKECQFRQVAGGLAHHHGRCHCHGGEGNGTPGMTLRQEAVEVWRRMRAGELYGRHGG